MRAVDMVKYLSSTAWQGQGNNGAIAFGNIPFAFYSIGVAIGIGIVCAFFSTPIPTPMVGHLLHAIPLAIG